MDLIKVEEFDGQMSDFSFNDHKIRCIFDIHNKPWFVGTDIGYILEYKNSRKEIGRLVKENYKCYKKDLKVCTNLVHIKLHPNTIMINESGLYSLICRSNMKEAVKFQDWVFEDVLPRLRKYGEYKLIRKHNHEIKLKDDKIGSLECKIEQMRLEFRNGFNEIKTQNKELLNKNDVLLNKNDELLNQNKETHVKLDTMTEKLDIVSEYVPMPIDNVNKKQIFTILKVNDLSCMYAYYIIRAQKVNTEHKMKKIKSKHKNSSVLIQLPDEANPIKFGLTFLDQLKIKYGLRFTKKNNYFKVTDLTDNELRYEAIEFDKTQRKQFAYDFDKK